MSENTYQPDPDLIEGFDLALLNDLLEALNEATETLDKIVTTSSDAEAVIQSRHAMYNIAARMSKWWRISQL